MCESVQRQADAKDVIVTSEMVEAGVYELRERTFGEPLDRIVKDVFRAMSIAGQDEKATASATIPS